MNSNITKIIYNVFAFLLLIFNLSLPFLENLNFNISIFISSSLLFILLLSDFFTKNNLKIHFYFGIFIAAISLFNDFSASVLYVYSLILLVYLIFINFVKMSDKLPYLVYDYLSYKIYLLIISLIICFTLVYVLNFSAYLYILLGVSILIIYVLAYNLYYYRKINEQVSIVLNDFAIPTKLENILNNNKYLAESTISYFSLYLSFAYFINGNYYKASQYYFKYDIKCDDYFIYYLYEILILLKDNKNNKIDKLLKEYESRINLINNKLRRKVFLNPYTYLYNIVNKIIFKKNLELINLDKKIRKYNLYNLLDDIYLNNDLSKYKNNNLIRLLK